MIRYAIYRRDTGRITCVGVTSMVELSLVVPNSETLSIIAAGEEVSTQMHYVANSEVISRPVFPATLDKQAIVADGSDAATISAIPNPSDLVVNGQTVTVIDGSLVLTADTGATYEVSCSQWPYLDWSVTIVATPPGA